jgi:phage-related protein
MTVINKLNQTLESIRGAECQCRTFSMDTDDANAKLLYTQVADNLKTCESMLQGRINYVESQEPQYSPSSQQQQIQQQAQMQNQQKTQNQKQQTDKNTRFK